VLKHTSTYSTTELTNKQQSQEKQNHGQQYFLDIKPHKLFSHDILGNKAIMRRLQTRFDGRSTGIRLLIRRH